MAILALAAAVSAQPVQRVMEHRRMVKTVPTHISGTQRADPIVGPISIMVTGMAIMQRLYSRAAGPGGNGGAAGAQAQANFDGAAGTLKITNSNANVDFVSTGGDLTNGRPTRQKQRSAVSRGADNL